MGGAPIKVIVNKFAVFKEKTRLNGVKGRRVEMKDVTSRLTGSFGRDRPYDVMTREHGSVSECMNEWKMNDCANE